MVSSKKLTNPNGAAVIRVGSLPDATTAAT
jgi:hypothetical protein